jgi:hypothetical protein
MAQTEHELGAYLAKSRPVLAEGGQGEGAEAVLVVDFGVEVGEVEPEKLGERGGG